MTIFVSMPDRRYAISDAYVMALTFIITVWVTKITMKVIKKQTNKNKKLKFLLRGEEVRKSNFLTTMNSHSLYYHA